MASVATFGSEVAAAPTETKAPGEWHVFRNWALVWLVLANAGFAVMWLVGAPPRAGEIVGIGAIGLFVRDKPLSVQVSAFVLALAYSLLSFIAGLFNLGVTSLISSMKFFVEIDPLQSVEYIAGGLAVALLMGAAIWRMRHPQGFTSNRMLLLAVGAILSLAAIDTALGMGMRGHYKRAATAGTPFESATAKSGFADATAVAQRRHLMLIMVESLGEPVDNPEMSRLLFTRYKSGALADRFDLSQGTTTYYNSTTAGEVREMCGRWGDYYELLDGADNSCLPAQLARQGYETRAFHSFTGDFFERESWYPNIGFAEQTFADGLVERGARPCGGVFPGACDRDVPAMLADTLKQADTPQFLYWLTLNSHLPVPPGLNLEVDNCERVSPALAADFPMICRQFAIWDAVDAAIIEQITQPDFPPTDILIVGDHMPPYFDRHHRSQFAPDRVPWLMLRWKGDEMPAAEVAP